MRAQDWITLVGVVAAVATLAFGLRQYVQAQQWKRAEFVAQEMKEFESHPPVKNAMYMLDWRERDIELFPDRDTPGERIVHVTDALVIDALATQLPDGTKFTETQAAIRDAFDDFLDGLERFDHFVESGLVSNADFRPYLIYWIRLIADTATNRGPLQPAIRKYINTYYASGRPDGTRYSPVEAFIAAFGYQITRPNGGEPDRQPTRDPASLTNPDGTVSSSDS